MEPIELTHDYTLQAVEEKGFGDEPLIALVRPDGSPARFGGPPPDCMSNDAFLARMFACVALDLEMLEGRAGIAWTASRN